jgi:ADP-heptose:LPS heptosyltransferase
LEIETDDLKPLLVPSLADANWADAFVARHLTSEHPSIVVHPGAGKTENVWAPGNFAEVINRLGRKSPINICVIEGPRDREHVDKFAENVEGDFVHLRGRGIGEVAALLQRVDLVLCNDTGVMHVSCAAGANTLAVFGPTDPKRWAPKCDNLSVIRGTGGDLNQVSIESVCEKAAGLLGLIDRAEGNFQRQ